MRGLAIVVGLWWLALGWSQQVVWRQPILSGQAVAYSPDGQWLATPTVGNRVALYQGGQLVRFLEGNEAPIADLVFSSDSQAVLALTTDGQLLRWQVSTGTLTWQVPTGAAMGVCLVRAGANWVAVGGSEGRLELRNASTGALERTLMGHIETVRAIALAPNGEELVSVDEAGIARTWQIAGGTLQNYTWQAHVGAATAVAWSPDGTRIATASEDGQIRLWARNFAGEWVLAHVMNAHVGSVARLIYASASLLYSAGGMDGKVRGWSPATGDPAGEFDAHAAGIVSMALHPGGNTLATSGFDQQVHLWNPATGTRQATLGGHQAPVVGVGFAANNLIWSASNDGTVRFWAFDTGGAVGASITHDTDIQAVAVSPDGAMLAVGDWNGHITVYALADGARLRQWNAHTEAIVSLAYSPDGGQLVSGSVDGTARVWNPATGTLLRTLAGHAGGALAVAYGAGVIATGDAAGQVRLWNASNGQLLRTLEGHTEAVLCLAFSPDGSLVASGSADGTVRVRSTTGDALAPPLVGHEFGATAVAFVDDQRLFTTDGTGYVRLYEVSTGTLVGQWQPTPARIATLAVSADGRYLLAGGDEGIVLLQFTETLNRPPSVPELLEPPNDATVGRSPSFRVRATDPDGDALVVELEVDQGGQRRVLRSEPQPSGSEFTLTLNAPLRPGIATWRARALDSLNAVSNWSDTRTFTVNNQPPSKPEILEPAAGATTNDRPQFRVRLTDPEHDRCRVVIRVSGANGFELTLTSGFVDSGAEVRLSPSEPLAPGTYTWQARAEDEFSAESDWTEAREFTVPQPNRPPSPPERLEPQNGASTTSTPTFRLRATDPDNDQVKVRIEIRLADNTTRLQESAFQASGSEFTIVVPNTQPLPAGTHQWRARAVDNRDGVSDWTEWWTFQVPSGDNGGGNNGGGDGDDGGGNGGGGGGGNSGDNPPANRPPTTPVLRAPASGATTSPTPTFRLQADDPDNDRVQFEIEIAIGGRMFSFTTDAVNSGQEAVWRVPIAQALPEGSGQWRARARDSANNYSNWSEPRVISVSAAVPRQLQGVQSIGLTLQVPDASLSALNLGMARVVEWDAQTQQYRDVTQLQIGRGYFVKADAPVQPEFSGVPISGEVVIPLGVGWNFVSNPYLTPLAWELSQLRVRRGGETRPLREGAMAGWLEPYAWVWNSTQRRYELVYDPREVPSAQGAVPSGAGMWLLAWEPCELVVAPSAGGRAGRSIETTARGWSLRVQARVGAFSDEVVIGVGSALRAPAPPSAPESHSPLQLRLRRGQAALSAEVRSSHERPEWELEVAVAPSNAPQTVELVLPDWAYLPHAVALVLVDTQTGRAIPLRGSPRYTFTAPAEGGVFRFRIEPSRTQAILRILQPAVQGGRSTNGQFTIQATLTTAAQLQVRILAAGRVVRTLPLIATRSGSAVQAVWDGRDDAGRALPPGNYLVQLTAQSEDGQTARAVVPLILTR